MKANSDIMADLLYANEGVWGKIFSVFGFETPAQSISHAQHFFKNPIFGKKLKKISLNQFFLLVAPLKQR